MMKKLALLLVIVLCFAFVGCNAGSAEQEETISKIQNPAFYDGSVHYSYPKVEELAEEQANALVVVEFVAMRDDLDENLSIAPAYGTFRIVSCPFGNLPYETITVRISGYGEENYLFYGEAPYDLYCEWKQPELEADGTRYIMMLVGGDTVNQELVFDQLGGMYVPYNDVYSGIMHRVAPIWAWTDGMKITRKTTGEEFLNYVYLLMQDNEPFDEETWLSEQTTEEETTVAETMDGSVSTDPPIPLAKEKHDEYLAQALDKEVWPTKSDLQSIQMGMKLQEVYESLGLPQRSVKLIIPLKTGRRVPTTCYIYTSSDGYALFVWYVANADLGHFPEDYSTHYVRGCSVFPLQELEEMEQCHYPWTIYDPNGVPEEDIERIEFEMSYEEVVAIIGKENREVPSDSAIYEWIFKYGKYLYIYFDLETMTVDGYTVTDHKWEEYLN